MLCALCILDDKKEVKIKVSTVSVSSKVSKPSSSKPTSSYSVPDSDDDSSVQGKKLSLAERLALKKTLSPIPSGGSGSAGTIQSYFTSSSTTAKTTSAAGGVKSTKAPAAVKKAPVAKKSKIIDLDDDDEDNDDDDEPVAPSGE